MSKVKDVYEQLQEATLKPRLKKKQRKKPAYIDDEVPPSQWEELVVPEFINEEHPKTKAFREWRKKKK